MNEKISFLGPHPFWDQHETADVAEWRWDPATKSGINGLFSFVLMATLRSCGLDGLH
jgi:hypothetical protein